MWGQIDTASDSRARELRKCVKCAGGALAVVHVTQHYSRGLPTGRSYLHRCGGCQATLESISTWRALTQLGFAASLTIGGFVMTLATVLELFEYGPTRAFGDSGSLWRSLLGVVLLVGGLAWAAWTTWRAANLVINHPVVGSR
jgi:hypothetical protein